MNYENSDDTISSDETELSYMENKCLDLKKRKISFSMNPQNIKVFHPW